MNGDAIFASVLHSIINANQSKCVRSSASYITFSRSQATKSLAVWIFCFPFCWCDFHYTVIVALCIWKRIWLWFLRLRKPAFEWWGTINYSQLTPIKSSRWSGTSITTPCRVHGKYNTSVKFVEKKNYKMSISPPPPTKKKHNEAIMHHVLCIN